MELTIENCGRRFGRDWIFRHLNISIPKGTQGVFVGPNGSGKSTLLQVCSGFLTPSEGKVHYTSDGVTLDPESVFRNLAFAAPYLDVFEELTLVECFEFQRRFIPFRHGYSSEDLLELCELPAHRDKQVKHFSSGMRQRLKLTLAIMSETSLLCLDEPTSNLDKAAIAWYRSLLKKESHNRTILVSTNHNSDDFLDDDFKIDLLEYQK